MNKLIPAIVALILVSCSPIVYNIAVDVKKPSGFDVDFKGCPPSIVCVCSREGMDSMLTSQMALGIAERLEKEMTLDEGTVPVYSYFTDELDALNPDDVAYLLITAGSDRVIVLDSLSRGDFKVSHPSEKVLHGIDLYTQTNVKQSFRIGFKMFCLDSLNYGVTPMEVSSVVSDYFHWDFLSSAPLEDTKAVAKAMSSSPKAFSSVGDEIGSMFFPQWEEQKRMIISYESQEWATAYQKAKSFKWAEAMNIWLKFVKGSDPKKVSFAAFNLAVACEMQEQYDLALEWLDLAYSKYPFSEISDEKANVRQAMKERKK